MAAENAQIALPLLGVWLARPHPIPTGGVPLAVKDLFDTAGLRTTYGSILFADHIPDRSAEAVVRLERAGYTNVGKTNLHEFAYGLTSQNRHFGTVPNPIAPGRIAGGSSGGSAAARASLQADAALGRDSGGSIRVPAACCGIVGFKPSFGLIPLDGCFPLAPTFDHAGPMARTVAACAAMMEALAPHVNQSASTDARIGIAWTELCDPLVGERVRDAGRLIGAEPLDFPFPAGLSPAFMAEVAGVHRDLFAESSESYGPNVRTKIERCLALSETEIDAGRRAREAYRDRAAAAIEGFDLLIVPTLGFVAPPLPGDELDIRERLIQFTLPFNALGWPTLALPAGTAEDGLPASVQIVGRPGDDAQVLAVGHELEALLSAGRTGAER